MLSRRATGRLSRRVTSAVFVILTGQFAASTPIAEAQTGGPVLSPRTTTVLESDGQVVLTLSISWARPARVKYQTYDGEAKAPGDYGAVSGEAVIANGNSVTIRIPIVDDDVTEDEETFEVRAMEDSSSVDGWPWGVATVRIIDDDRAAGSDPPAVTNTTSQAQPSGSSALTPAGGEFVSPVRAPGLTADTPAPTTTTTTTVALASPPEAAMPSGDVRPGPGFQLTSEGVSEPAAERPNGAGGSASGLAIGAGAAVLGVGALAVERRRRRWSPTQA